MTYQPFVKKTPIVVVGLAVVAAITGATLLRKEKKPSYRTARIDRGEIISAVAATGALSALVTVQVGSQVSGMIKELSVDFNSVVRRGQVVARLDPALFEAQVGQARANVATGRANAERIRVAEVEAARALKRAAELRAKELNSESDLEAAQTALESAEANVRAAEAQVAQADAALNSATVNFEHTVITAPVDGIVISRNVDVGQTVAASLQAPTLFTIAGDLTHMQVHANISEADVGRIQVGQEASFTVDAYPGRRFQGHLTQIRNSPSTIQNVVTYDGVIDVNNDDLTLKPGMTATVAILAARKQGILKLPNAALRFKPPTSEAVPNGRPLASERGQSVWVLAENALKKIPVKTGITDGVFSELIGGELKEGSEVVVESAGMSPMPNMPRMGGMGRPF